MKEAGLEISYLVGTMIELPRAAIRAHIIAEAAEFFSFGTNDLTQTTFGISRDDASAFIPTTRRRASSSTIPSYRWISRCGRTDPHRRETRPPHTPRHEARHLRRTRRRPASIHFCEDVGLDYVSCSPFRVPIARLSAAQAAIKAER